ncbi:Rrf2 family transcriptional regulator [Sulfitobacter sp. S190]|uniref:RrF2 family transcriptional regulator n=1 Tax=Sulfitobacter sp. S190 TaxID=2867022 RepID=UPI0021A571C0|nr:Rrf2 family transcriptional regulator [Sulfitobacter sp. S190]UWR24596.1 Rrf2 family transcriptional regulator [Sulfitobacter sp. S190]
MKLTFHADYAIRVLLFLRAVPGRRGTTTQIAKAHNISRAHLEKVVQRMVTAGFVETSRGRGGGVRLTRDPDTITIGAIIRAMEDDLAIVECLGHARFCRVAGVCGARNVFSDAMDAYFAVLDNASLEDIARNQAGLRGALQIVGGRAQA